MNRPRQTLRHVFVIPGLIIVLFGLLIGAFSGCGNDDNWISVSGKVIDQNTQLTIASAWLALDDTLASSRFGSTDTTGVFYIPLLPFSQISLSAVSVG